MRRFLETLLHIDDAGAVVTVTARLDRRRPTGDDDRIRFRNLMADARGRVAALSDRAQARQLLNRLDQAASRVDLGGGAQGVVVVATPEADEVRSLPFPVRDGVPFG